MCYVLLMQQAVKFIYFLIAEKSKTELPEAESQA